MPRASNSFEVENKERAGGCCGVWNLECGIKGYADSSGRVAAWMGAWMAARTASLRAEDIGKGLRKSLGETGIPVRSHTRKGVAERILRRHKQKLHRRDLDKFANHSRQELSAEEGNRHCWEMETSAAHDNLQDIQSRGRKQHRGQNVQAGNHMGRSTFIPPGTRSCASRRGVCGHGLGCFRVGGSQPAREANC